MAEISRRQFIEAAGVTPAEVDFIVFGTTTPDLVFPNCGTLLQARLGARGCPAFSVETACSGFIYAMSIADKFIKAGEAKAAEFLDFLLSQSPADRQALYRAGLDRLQADARNRSGAAFAAHADVPGEAHVALVAAGEMRRAFGRLDLP